MNAPLPGQERNNGPLYRLPWSVVFNTALVASVTPRVKWSSPHAYLRTEPGNLRNWVRDLTCPSPPCFDSRIRSKTFFRNLLADAPHAKELNKDETPNKETVARPLEQTGGIGALGFGIGVITWLGLGAGTYQ
jgi:hypothetical protein